MATFYEDGFYIVYVVRSGVEITVCETEQEATEFITKINEFNA